uniref:Uncharacterized protein n=1 Tax=Chromera velia CCMP2878 TaxID=1169474 RepID=A0A0G4GUG4_9ALVE|eukprot:Cvel_738.t1-p1 / transcript=Cvel_738.t1 / gene=Cvel_738 / organism=Chromera_velia_CCMP2878 / gene_product=hypothetical protein / transcript_product=hypothetical protein / location=Cvel_scaffold23:15170-16450(-) / protein_length=427 / sequence_SO=supercontig / SO=protein_coding / is_pseudo=false
MGAVTTQGSESVSQKSERRTWNVLLPLSVTIFLFSSTVFICLPVGYSSVQLWSPGPLSVFSSWIRGAVFFPLLTILGSLALVICLLTGWSPKKRGRDFWIAVSILTGLLFLIAVLQVVAWTLVGINIWVERSWDGSGLQYLNLFFGLMGGSLATSGTVNQFELFRKDQNLVGSLSVAIALSVLFSALLLYSPINSCRYARQYDREIAETEKGMVAQRRKKTAGTLMLVSAVCALLWFSLCIMSFTTMPIYWYFYLPSISQPIVEGYVSLAFALLALVGAFRLSVGSSKGFWVAVFVFAALVSIIFFIEAVHGCVRLAGDKYGGGGYHPLAEIAAHGFVQLSELYGEARENVVRSTLIASVVFAFPAAIVCFVCAISCARIAAAPELTKNKTVEEAGHVSGTDRKAVSDSEGSPLDVEAGGQTEVSGN